MKKVIDEINNNINSAAKIAIAKGKLKDVGEILLVAVSKTHPYERIIEAQECGLNVFGENKVQELVDKYPHIKNASWHLIGNLQRNKVKYIIDKVQLIHSVDSYELAEEINKRAAGIHKKMHILVQVNIGREASKGGILEEDVENFMGRIASFENIIVSGLMTIPPAKVEENITREYFKKMYQIYETVKKLDYANFDIKHLSMGMTGDYEIAIEEGANMIRVGTGIFGKRDYNVTN